MSNAHRADRDRAFITRYPRLFGPPDRLARPLASEGLAIGDGWIPILEDLCQALLPLVAEDQLAFRIIQVKEMFGELRVHATGGNSWTSAQIDSASILSMGTCIRCAAPKPTNGTSPLCQQCRQSLQAQD